jgi:hypothetical protein
LGVRMAVARYGLVTLTVIDPVFAPAGSMTMV